MWRIERNRLRLLRGCTDAARVWFHQSEPVRPRPDGVRTPVVPAALHRHPPPPRPAPRGALHQRPFRPPLHLCPPHAPPSPLDPRRPAPPPPPPPPHHGPRLGAAAQASSNPTHAVQHRRPRAGGVGGRRKEAAGRGEQAGLRRQCPRRLLALPVRQRGGPGGFAPPQPLW